MTDLQKILTSFQDRYHLCYQCIWHGYLRRINLLIPKDPLMVKRTRPKGELKVNDGVLQKYYDSLNFDRLSARAFNSAFPLCGPNNYIMIIYVKGVGRSAGFSRDRIVKFYSLILFGEEILGFIRPRAVWARNSLETYSRHGETVA